jgi:cobyrinic acid a,c-diamide synthase
MVSPPAGQGAGSGSGSGCCGSGSGCCGSGGGGCGKGCDGDGGSAGPYELPRVVVAAPASGQGKTTVATGLMAALRARGLTVSPHKVGPDYIDPSYHALAAGRPGRNLDPWLVGEHRLAPLLLHGATAPGPADVAVIEGVMGLYDGAFAGGDFASTAHVARLVGAPVLLVVDARAQSRTAAALVLGMRAFDPRVRIGGVVLNHVGSGGHEQLLRAALAEIGVPVLGVLRRQDDVTAPSRHLGLVPVAERARRSAAMVAALAELVTASVDLDAVLALARSAPPLDGAAWDPVIEVGGKGCGAGGSGAEGRGVWSCGAEGRGVGGCGAGGCGAGGCGAVDSGPVVAVAGGAAFTFSYAETAELLTAAGARVVPFDPLTEPRLPAGTRGVVIGGGFPELHAEALSGNGSLRTELAAFDGPVVAECAGLLYLGRSLDGVPMCGRLDLQARMTGRLTLGYREAVAVSDSPVAARGEVVRGHEFHRTATDPGHGPHAAWCWDDQRHGFVSDGVHASYLHTHWAGHPTSAVRFVEACA